MAKPMVILAIISFLTLAQIGGCHYYINAVPRFIISSEPIHISESNTQPEQP